MRSPVLSLLSPVVPVVPRISPEPLQLPAELYDDPAAFLAKLAKQKAQQVFYLSPAGLLPQCRSCVV